MTLIEAVDAYVAAYEARREVCDTDHRGGMGGNSCSYCDAEQAALEAVRRQSPGRNTDG